MVKFFGAVLLAAALALIGTAIVDRLAPGYVKSVHEAVQPAPTAPFINWDAVRAEAVAGNDLKLRDYCYMIQNERAGRYRGSASDAAGAFADCVAWIEIDRRLAAAESEGE